MLFHIKYLKAQLTKVVSTRRITWKKATLIRYYKLRNATNYISIDSEYVHLGTINGQAGQLVRSDMAKGRKESHNKYISDLARFYCKSTYE